MGIGYLKEHEAQEDWILHHQRGLEDFGRYLALLEQGDLLSTPVEERIRALRLAVRSGNSDIFSQAC
jgi:hypothetical protein